MEHRKYVFIFNSIIEHNMYTFKYRVEKYVNSSSNDSSKI